MGNSSFMICLYMVQICFLSSMSNKASPLVPNATMFETISYIVSKTCMKSVTLYSDQNETLANDVDEILGLHYIQGRSVKDITSVKTLMGYEMRRAAKYFTVTEMKNNLNFIVICNNTCVINLLRTVKKIDLKYGRDIILRHYSRWIIVIPNGEYVTDFVVHLFDNSLVLSFTQKILSFAGTVVLTSEKKLERLCSPYEDVLFPNLQFGMKGTELIITTLEWAPHVKERKLSDGSVDFVGISTDILDGLATAFNFTYRFVKPEDKVWGSRGKDGNWSGVVGMLQRNEADLCPAPYAWNTERSEVMDFGFAFNYDEFVAIYKAASNHAEKWLVLTHPFRVTVYIYWFLVLFILAGLFLLFEYMSVHNRHERTFWTFLSITTHVISTPLQQASPTLPSSRSSRLLLCFWWLLNIVMTAVYTGNLMASLTVSVDEVPFTTLRELIDNDEYALGVFQDTQMDALFKISEVNLFKEARGKIKKFRKSSIVSYGDDLQYHTDLVSAGGYAVINSRKIADVIMSKECDVRTMKQVIVPLSSGFVFPKGSPLTNILSEQIRTMMETGLIEQWEQKWKPKKKICSLPSNVNAQSIDVDVLFSAIVVALVGIGTALTALVLELICKQMKKSSNILSSLNFFS